MSTKALEELLDSRRSLQTKLPDISQLHYQLNMPQNSIEDLNTKIARQNQTTQRFIRPWTEAIIEDRQSAEGSDTVTKAQKLIDAINGVGEAFDKGVEEEIRSNFRKNYGRNPDGHPLVGEAIDQKSGDLKINESDDKDNPWSKENLEKKGFIPRVVPGTNFPLDNQAINSSKIELNYIDKEIHEAIKKSDNIEDIEELIQPDPVKKITGNNAQIAELGFIASQNMFNELSVKQIYPVQGFGVLSFQYAFEEGLTFPDGSSVAEAIRQEIYSDIYVQLGLDRVPLRVLKKRYFEPLRQAIDARRLEEYKIKAQETYQNYKLDKNSTFLSSVIENASVALSGSPDQKGTNGYLSKWAIDGNKNEAVNEIISELRFAREQGHTERVAKATSAILNADYYVKGYNRPIDLQTWAKTDKDISLLLDEVGFINRQVNSTINSSRNNSDNNAWSVIAKNVITDVYNNYPDGFVPDENTVDEILTKVITDAKEDNTLSPHFKASLNIGSKQINDLRKQIRTRTQFNDDIYAQRAIESLAIEDPDDRDKKFNYWVGLISDNEIKGNILSRGNANIQGNQYAATMKKVSGPEGEISKLVDHYFKQTLNPAGDGGQTLRAATAYFEGIYQANLLKNMTEQEAYADAWEKVSQKLNPGNIVTRHFKGRQSPFSVDLTNLPSKEDNELLVANLNKANALVAQGFDLRTYNGVIPGEIDAINYQANNPLRTHAFYRNIVKTHYPGMDPWEFALLRRKFLIEKRDWSEFDKELWAKDGGVDLDQIPYLDKNALNEINKKLNELENQWWIDENIINPEVDIAGVDYDLADRPVIDVEEIVEEGQKLNEMSSAGEIAQFLAKANGTKYIEPVFEMLYNRNALKGDGFNHVAKTGPFNRKITLDKPLIDYTLTELKVVLAQNDKIARVGIFGFTWKELDFAINSMGLSKEEQDTLKFDKKMQGQLIWYKLRENLKSQNNLSTISAKDLKDITRFTNKEKKRFIELLKKQGVTIADIEGESEWTSDQGDTSNILVFSPWHTPDMLSPLIFPYLDSEDYQNTIIEDTNKARVAAVEQMRKVAGPNNAAAESAIKQMQNTNFNE